MKEPLLGWRSWSPDQEGYLWGMNNQIWETPSLKAECKKASHSLGARAPLLNCTCGIYAYREAYKNLLPGKDYRLSLLRAYFYARFALKSFLLLGEILFDGEGLQKAKSSWRGSKYLLSIFRLSKKEAPLAGIVAMSGKTLLYREGARSQHSQLLCLLFPRYGNKRVLAKIKANYAVPIFHSPRAARAYVSEMGRMDWGHE